VAAVMVEKFSLKVAWDVTPCITVFKPPRPLVFSYKFYISGTRVLQVNLHLSYELLTLWSIEGGAQE
jgi:hypothetical protein